MAVTLTFTYPLTPAQAEQIVKIHAEDNMKLNEDLESVRAICAEKCNSNTKDCVEHSKEVRRLWRSYYTSIRSGSWASYRPSDYTFEMRRLFDDKADIQEIHSRATKEKRMHEKDALCTVRIDDDPLVKRYKEEAAAMYDQDIPESQIREFIRDREVKVIIQRSAKQAEYDSKLAACNSEDEKRAVHKGHACTPADTDTPAMTNLRLKWQGLFDNGMPYAEIYNIIQKDVADHLRIERELKEKLDGFQRAKAAHGKAQIAKEVRKAAKEISAVVKMLSEYTFYCTSEGCQNLSVPISPHEGNLECGICNHLVRNGMTRDRSYFCSEECMERDGRSHILKVHNCAAADRCITGASKRGIHQTYSGICNECWKFFDFESYFCSNECRTKNWTDHCNRRHAQLRAELVEKLENNKDFFAEWKHKVHLTDEEVQRAMSGVSFSSESGRLATRTSSSP